jgi:hypothetical protein
LNASPLPLGAYHLTEIEASQLAQVSRFYVAYNAGRLATVMALLLARPILFDCDYATHTIVTLDGRGAIEAYLRSRFAEHDRWTVEFYQDYSTDERQVVVMPLQRANDTLLRLGAPGGVKRSFPVLLSLYFDLDRTHLDAISWRSVMGPQTVTQLCSP